MTRMQTDQTSLPADRVVTERAQWRTLLRRRKRFWNRIVLFVLVTTAMVLVAVANRDMEHWRATEKAGGAVADALQEYYERERDLLLRFPDLPQAYEGLRERYIFNIFYVDQKKWCPRVGVCCLKKPSRFFLCRDGRIVIVFDGERYSSLWMTEREFQAAGVGLGFDAEILRG